MNIKLFLPYYNPDFNEFDVSSDPYISNEDYFRHMQEEINKNDQMVSDYLNYGKQGNTYYASDDFGNGEIKSAKLNFSFCEGSLLNQNGQEESVDSFIDNYVKKNVCLYILKLDFDTMTEEFEEDIREWETEHNKITSRKDKTDEWKDENDPKITLRISFFNKANEEKCAQLQNCRLLEKCEYNIYIIAVEKIVLTEGII